MKRIGVLTSGGDAPGMNAAIRAVVRTAIYKGMSVIGINRGYNGLLNRDVYEMDLRSVSSIIQRGGTKLFSARSNSKRRQAFSRAFRLVRISALRVSLSSAATAPTAAQAIFPDTESPASVCRAPLIMISPAPISPSATIQQ